MTAQRNAAEKLKAIVTRSPGTERLTAPVAKG